MKNLIVANAPNDGVQKKLQVEVSAQLENTLNLGWKVEDIILVTNFDFEFMGIRAQNKQLHKGCWTGSKMFAVQQAFRDGVNDVIWAHDLDCWQTAFFECPEFKDVGISTYSNSKFNGGSVFWRPSAVDIIDKVVNIIVNDSLRKEEPTINGTLKSKEYKDRVTVLNNTFNVGCSGYRERYNRSDKPVKVCHFHPCNRCAWDTHVRDRNRMGVSAVSDKLMNLMLKYFGERVKLHTYKGERGYDGDYTRPPHLKPDGTLPDGELWTGLQKESIEKHGIPY